MIPLNHTENIYLLFKYNKHLKKQVPNLTFMALGSDNIVIEPSEYFLLNNGEKIRSLNELRDKINTIDESTFNYYVTKQKNDFSNWIKNVFNKPFLANSLIGKSKNEMYILLDNFLSNEIKTEKAQPETTKNITNTNLTDTEEKIKDMSNTISDIEENLYKVDEHGDIDAALKRLQSVYKEKIENHNPKKIVMHDAISKSESEVHLSDSIDTIENIVPEIKPEKTLHKVKETPTVTINEEEIFERDNQLKNNNHNLIRENHELKEKLKILKNKVLDTEKVQDDFEKNLRETYKEIETLKINSERKNKEIADLRYEKEKLEDEREEYEANFEEEKKKNNTTVKDLDKINILKKEIKKRDESIIALSMQKERLENKNSQLEKEIENVKQKTKSMVNKASSYIESLEKQKNSKEIQQKEDELHKREVIINETQKHLEKDTEELKKKEKELENVREEYIENVKSFIKQKKAIIEHEKEITKSKEQINLREQKLNKKEKEHNKREKELNKRLTKYEKDVVELRKELKKLI